MSFKLIYFLFLVGICVILSKCDNLQVGTSVNSKLAYVEDVKLSAIPLKVRIKNVFYNGEDNSIIKGISAIDNTGASNTKVSITAGGVGSTFVNLKLKSERGDGIDYQVQVFV